MGLTIGDSDPNPCPGQPGSRGLALNKGPVDNAFDMEVRARMQLESAPGSDDAPTSLRNGARWLRAGIGDFADRNVFVILVFAAVGLIRLGFVGIGIGSDTWYTLVGGRVVSDSWLPHADALTVFTRGRQWVDQQWLAHLVLYRSWSAGGWPLALLILLSGYLGAFALAAATARRLGGSARSTAVISLLCLVLALGESTFRAQTLAYVLFAALFYLVLLDDVRPTRLIYFTLPILVAWANVHGSVVLGAAVVALRGLTDAWKRRTLTPRTAVLLVAPWLCTLASPYGFALPGYYLRLLHNPALTKFVSEWQPATVSNEPLFFVLLLVVVLLLARRGCSLFQRLALLATAIGGLLAVRSVVWFALAATAVLPAALDAIWPAPKAPRRRGLNLAVAAASAAVLAAAAAAYAAHPRAWFEREYPSKAGAAVAAAAASDPSLKVFATERYADWLLFAHPGLAGRLAYDARFELLSQHQLTRIARFRLEQGVDWLRVADGYRLFVLDPSADRGAVELLRDAGARTLYRDGDVVVIERESAR